MEKKRAFVPVLLCFCIVFCLGGCSGSSGAGALPASQAPASQVPASQAPASQAPASAEPVPADRQTDKDGKNMLRSDPTTGQLFPFTVFGSEIPRYDVDSVTFLSTLDEMPAGAWDVSENSAGTVFAWANKNGNDKYDVYIGADGIISAADCQELFSLYGDVKRIEFNDCFDTSSATNMAYMFSGCGHIEELDLSGFDTSNVTNMHYMFQDCRKLTSLDLSSFDTSKVKDMSSMFDTCLSLASIKFGSRFETGKVTTMEAMFRMCPLEELDLSAWDISKLKDVSYMFAGCGKLRSLGCPFAYPARANDEKVFHGCENLTRK